MKATTTAPGSTSSSTSSPPPPPSSPPPTAPPSTASTTVSKAPVKRAVWAEGDDALRCYKCHADFGVIFTRRHHCRGCGQAFCHDCSQYYFPFPPEYGYTEPQRTCLKCYQHLSSNYIDEVEPPVMILPPTPVLEEEKMKELSSEPATPALLKAMAALDDAMREYEVEKGKGTPAEISCLRNLINLVETNKARLYRFEEAKLVHLLELLLEQIYFGSQFEKRVVDAFMKFIERDSLIAVLHKVDLRKLEFGRRYLAIPASDSRRKQRYFNQFLNFCKYFQLDALVFSSKDEKFIEDLRNYVATLPFEAQDVFPGLKSSGARSHTRLALNLLNERMPEGTDRLSVLLVGKTGVGKSTIFNEVLNNIPGTDSWSIEAPGGTSVTDELKTASRHVGDKTLTLIDSPGLDCSSKMQGYVWERLVARIMDGFDEYNPLPPINVIWYCILSATNRLDSVEEEWIRTFSQFVPVVLVLTKASFCNTQQFEEWLEDRDPPLTASRIIKLHARPTMLLEQAGGAVVPSFGLPELIEETVDLLADSESKRTTYLACVKETAEADLIRKQRISLGWIVTASTTAAAIGAVPIPFADAMLLIPVHVGMLSAISQTFGAPLDRGFLTTMVGAIFGGGGAALGGRAVVAGLVELLKIVPGFNIASMVISGTTACFFTVALGLSYLQVMVKLSQSGMLGTDKHYIQELVITKTKETLSKGQSEVMKQFQHEREKLGISNADADELV
ncbi:DUF697 domain-containing protein [Balamuthia mandrillaris]